MDEKDTVQTIPFIAHEGEVARLERIIHRLFVVVILLIVLLVGTNAGWIYYESQFEDTVVTQDIETGEGNALVAGIGDVNYGESQTNGENP